MSHFTSIVISFICLSAFTNNSFSQKNDPIQTAVSRDSLFNDVEVHLSDVQRKPEFPGGKKAWHDFLRNNINLALIFSNKPVAGSYPLLVRIIVNSDGKLRETGAISNVGYGMEAEFIRCIKKSPDWIPAETGDGKKVSFTLHVSVTFKVTTGNIEMIF